MKKKMRSSNIIPTIFLVFLLSASSITFFDFGLDSSLVTVIKIDGVITVATLDLIKEGFDEAQRTNAKAIVLLLDTPGGLWD
ncbi:MAG: hypothetical protein QXL67_05470, partial [Candidatus Bathyarchaeia archaeon]